MYEISVLTDDGTLLQKHQCADARCSIGRQDQAILLKGWSIGKHHADIVLEEDGLYVQDKGSMTGTLVNGARVRQYGPLTAMDSIEIGSYVLQVKPLLTRNADATAETEFKSVASESVATVVPPAGEASVYATATAASDDQIVQREARVMVHKELLKLIDLRRIDVNAMSDDQLRAMVLQLLSEVAATIQSLPAAVDMAKVSKEVLNEVVGLGAIQDLLQDESISEVMVNSPDEIFFERRGKLIKSAITFTDNRAVMSAIERIVAPLGRRIDESSPMVDARLKDGSRVNAIIPPLALKGPSITIRKFMSHRLGAKDLLRFGSANEAMVRLLEICVNERKNIVISGGTGSGKTTLLNILSNFIPDDERIVTVEDAAELKLYQPNLVSLEARPPNPEGRGAVSIRELVRNCLRMRPDRIVVGECRGGEALDMLQAMNTGHDGSLTTLHANTPRDAVARLEVMVMMAGMDLPITAIREQIASSVNLIVQQTRFPCGSRRITSITELTGMESGRVQMAEIFSFERQGYDNDGKVNGRFIATGQVPEFYEELRARGYDLDLSIFRRTQDAS